MLESPKLQGLSTIFLPVTQMIELKQFTTPELEWLNYVIDSQLEASEDSEDWAFLVGKQYAAIYGRPHEYASFDAIGARLIFLLREKAAHQPHTQAHSDRT